MKIRRITALVMALLLCALAFVSCKKDEEAPVDSGSDTTAGQKSADDLKNYMIIRSENASGDISTACMKLSTALGNVTGVKTGVRNDSSVEAADESFEILVGDTNRAQSAAAKNALTSLGYSITVSGNKIVIVASNDMILVDAIDYFISNLKATDNGYEYPKNYLSTEYQTLDLISNGAANYRIVFTDFYNNLNKHTDACKYELGFTRTKVKELAEELKTLTGVTFSTGDEARMSPNAKEIVVGKIDGESNPYFEYYQSGVYLKDGDIYIYGHNHEGIENAISAFLSRVKKYNSDIDDQKYSLLCDQTGYKWSNNDIKYDIPLPEGLAFEGAYTAANNGIYMLYDNSTKDTFDKYVSLLEANGFTQYFARQASTNLFAGYYKGDDAAWVYYINDRQEMRVVFEKYQPLPDFGTGSGTAVASITQMGVSYTESDDKYGAGMGYIVTLTDGRYIIVDGNISYKSNEALATEYYNFLKDNNKRTDGKIVIAAWIITHGHSDHYRNFEYFGMQYGDKVECQYIIHNLPTELTLYGGGNVDLYYLTNQQMIDGYFKGATVFTPHTGYAFNAGGVFVEFMSTYEDMYDNHDLITHPNDPSVPNSVDEMNDTCLTFRFVFNQGESNETGVFILGDNYFAHGERLASMWDAAYLQTTVVQVAHHGWQNGVTSGQVDKKDGIVRTPQSTLYNEIKASYGLWSNSYEHMSGGNGSVVKTILVGIRQNIRIYCNTASSGSAANYTLTFSGNSIKVTETVK